jgi:hypothetical protein
MRLMFDGAPEIGNETTAVADDLDERGRVWFCKQHGR